MEEQFLNEILKDTYTLESFKQRVMALKLNMQERLYEPGGEKTETKVDESAADTRSDSSEKTKKWLEKFDTKILEGIRGDNFKAVFDEVEGFISQKDTLTIYLVFIPDEEQVKEIGEWLRKGLKNPKLIFSIKIDPDLIGGCAIVYKGVYRDYSLKARISSNKEKLMDEFRQYLKQ